MNLILLLLARGRDRLETDHYKYSVGTGYGISYSLGDAIDWKRRESRSLPFAFWALSYSLGDAIDWKLVEYNYKSIYSSFLLLARGRDRLETLLSLSSTASLMHLLLARGRDRLETGLVRLKKMVLTLSPTR